MYTKLHTPLAFTLALVMSFFVACGERQLKEAVVEIVDPDRHYYPVLQGEMMGVTYEIENISDATLFIQEVQTTCGCLVPTGDLPLVILPKRSGMLHLAFNTIKNTGYVDHYIWCYGNFADSAYRELHFDTNIVPAADYIRDYEQLFREQPDQAVQLKDLVNGKFNERGYYTDGSVEDPRATEQRENQQMMDDLLF